jgi:RNA polymerase sigma-70 factor, ECF subfamily
MGSTTSTGADLSPTSMVATRESQERLYERVLAEYSAPLARLVRAHEADPSLRHDLAQEIHMSLWRSLAVFDGRCSLRTWVYRVAHNIAASFILKSRRQRLDRLCSIDDIELPDESDVVAEVDASRVLERLDELIRSLKPLDRQLMILHLEGVDARDIAEIAGLSLANAHTKLHRIRELLARRINAGDRS